MKHLNKKIFYAFLIFSSLQCYSHSAIVKQDSVKLSGKSNLKFDLGLAAGMTTSSGFSGRMVHSSHIGLQITGMQLTVFGTDIKTMGVSFLYYLINGNICSLYAYQGNAFEEQSYKDYNGLTKYNTFDSHSIGLGFDCRLKKATFSIMAGIGNRYDDFIQRVYEIGIYRNF